MVDISQNPTGRLLLEKSSEPVALLAPSVGAFVALLFSISYFFIEPDQNTSRVESIILGIALFFGSVALVFVTYVIWKTRILVFEKCLCKATPIRSIFLYYDQVEAISYSITRKSITRVYMGTQ